MDGGKSDLAPTSRMPTSSGQFVAIGEMTDDDDDDNDDNDDNDDDDDGGDISGFAKVQLR